MGDVSKNPSETKDEGMPLRQTKLPNEQFSTPQRPMASLNANRPLPLRTIWSEIEVPNLIFVCYSVTRKDPEDNAPQNKTTS